MKEERLYGNYKMIHPNGELMCYCSTRRAKWYTDRDLAEYDEDNIVRLKFTPNGFGEPDILLEGRKNICVMSGVDNDLTKHHVVPTQYRKFFDYIYKDKNSLDIVLLNRDRHDDYEIIANDLKYQLENDFIKEHGDIFEEENEKSKLFAEYKKYNSVLHNNLKIPADKQIYMQMRLDGIGKKYNVGINEVLEYLQNINNAYSKYVVDYIGVEILIVLWKLHFIKFAKPKFLPNFWKPNMVKKIVNNAYIKEKKDVIYMDMENNIELNTLIKKYDLYETAKLYI
jgi:hypothetical protein